MTHGRPRIKCLLAVGRDAFPWNGAVGVVMMLSCYPAHRVVPIKSWLDLVVLVLVVTCPTPSASIVCRFKRIERRLHFELVRHDRGCVERPVFAVPTIRDAQEKDAGEDDGCEPQ